MNTIDRTLVPATAIPALVAGLYVASIATSLACPTVALTAGIVSLLGVLLAAVAS